jgi:hypothetical protein
MGTPTNAMLMGYYYIKTIEYMQKYGPNSERATPYLRHYKRCAEQVRQVSIENQLRVNALREERVMEELEYGFSDAQKRELFPFDMSQIYVDPEKEQEHYMASLVFDLLLSSEPFLPSYFPNSFVDGSFADQLKVAEAYDIFQYGRQEALHVLNASSSKAHSDEARTNEARNSEAHSDEARTDEACNSEARNSEARNSEAHSTEAHRIEARSIEARSIEANRIEARSIEVPGIEAPSIEAPSIEAHRNEVHRNEARTNEARNSDALTEAVPEVSQNGGKKVEACKCIPGMYCRLHSPTPSEVNRRRIRAQQVEVIDLEEQGTSSQNRVTRRSCST